MKQTFLQKAGKLVGILATVGTIVYAIYVAAHGEHPIAVIIPICAAIFLFDAVHNYLYYKDEILRLNKRIYEYDKQNKELKERLELLYDDPFVSD